MTEKIYTTPSKGKVTNIKTGSLYPCHETCEINFGAVGASSHNPKIVGMRPKEIERSQSMFAAKQRRYGVAAANKEEGTINSR